MVRQKIPTHIENFDEKLDGGIPEGSVVLLAGGTGTMKSSVAFSILFYNALNNSRKGVYISLEQSRRSLLQNMTYMGMDINKTQDNLSVLDLGLIRKSLKDIGNQNWLQVFKMYAENLKNNMNYDLLVVDTLSILELLASFEDPRTDLFHFFNWVRDLRVTALLISEMDPDSQQYGRYDEDFLADGVINLVMEEKGDINIQRKIRCVKMRSANHSPNFFTLLFSKGKFQTTSVIADNMF
ncbi:MAG: ATPase domain-containing protein [Thermoplasmata archaeon]